MKLKYATLGTPMGTPGKGRKSDPSKWKTGPCLLTREKYYAWLKHKSQANYRDEDYSLTWEQWQTLWPNHLWEKRGKTSDSVILGRVDWSQGWHNHNVQVMDRRRHFEIRKAYNDRP